MTNTEKVKMARELGIRWIQEAKKEQFGAIASTLLGCGLELLAILNTKGGDLPKIVSQVSRPPKQKGTRKRR